LPSNKARPTCACVHGVAMMVSSHRGIFLYHVRAASWHFLCVCVCVCVRACVRVCVCAASWYFLCIMCLRSEAELSKPLTNTRTESFIHAFICRVGLQMYMYHVWLYISTISLLLKIT
jgi:hypothetical protein